MLTHATQKRPVLEMLSQPFLERIVSEAMEVLSKVGIFVENKDALALLGDAGARVDRKQRVLLPEDLVWRCVRSAPSPIQIFDRQGQASMLLEGLNVHFDPGSAALKILDHRTGEARAPQTEDLVAFADAGYLDQPSAQDVHVAGGIALVDDRRVSPVDTNGGDFPECGIGDKRGAPGRDLDARPKVGPPPTGMHCALGTQIPTLTSRPFLASGHQVVT